MICVGNLTVGGTGKTPLAVALAKMLQEKNVPVAFLARGYLGRGSDALLVDSRTHDAKAVGDEALLLARAAPTIVARDRAQGARLAEAQGARAIVMDDGYQNFALGKDWSVVVVDGETGFGNGRIVPAGPLRESVRQGIARADAVIVMGNGNPSLPGFAGPVLRARLSANRRLDGKRVVAFAGIGRPAKFFDTLRDLGAEIAATCSYGDHHFYSRADIASLRAQAKLVEATLITTEKDLVRLNGNDREGVDVLPVHAAFDEPAAIGQILDEVLARKFAGP